jgi:exodeoxyribonuclease VII large subunit
MNNEQLTVTVSQFVDMFNQTMEFAYPHVVIVGELANFRVSKNKWVYFDLKDDDCSLKFFGSVFRLPGPLEDGLILKVAGQPRLHNLYGFSINFTNIQAAGEGSIRKAADLLRLKLETEGLFDESRKRSLPYPPGRIGLITSDQSAAYADFKKIVNARWRGLKIDLINVQVQGEPAPAQIVYALDKFNARAEPPEVIVLIRGGGSAEDLFAFSTEQVTRAVAASRIPTLVAIGHEIDLSLAELAADMRASTPSNAAELLVPDVKQVANQLKTIQSQMDQTVKSKLALSYAYLDGNKAELDNLTKYIIETAKNALFGHAKLIEAFNPSAVLKRGYSLVRNKSGQVIADASEVAVKDILQVQLHNGSLTTEVQSKD